MSYTINHFVSQNESIEPEINELGKRLTMKKAAGNNEAL
jgi:hypothetical protein